MIPAVSGGDSEKSSGANLETIYRQAKYAVVAHGFKNPCNWGYLAMALSGKFSYGLPGCPRIQSGGVRVGGILARRTRYKALLVRLAGFWPCQLLKPGGGLYLWVSTIIFLSFWTDFCQNLG
jgi:hypothetical protein